MLLLFLEAVKVFAAGAETVLEILDLVAESCDVLGLSLKVDGGEGVGEIMGLDIRLEVVELDQRGVHVGLYHGSGFFELLDVGIHQLELLKHLVDFFGFFRASMRSTSVFGAGLQAENAKAAANNRGVIMALSLILSILVTTAKIRILAQTGIKNPDHRRDNRDKTVCYEYDYSVT